MGACLPIDVLLDVSLVLIEKIVNTTLGTAVVAPGSQAINPPSMVGIAVGVVIAVDRGTANQEAVAVTAVTGTSFTATFANVHLSTAAVVGATFTSGLFTQQEMLGYLLQAENDFLLKTRSVYGVAQQNLVTGAPGRYYPQPANAIRIEHVSSNGHSWADTSQLMLDLNNQNWQSESSSDDPKAWFQDEIALERFGIYPLVQVPGVVAELWFSIKDLIDPLGFLTSFVLPDIFAQVYLKYGVLARAFAKDGEQRDDMRSKYCAKRFEFGVFLARSFVMAADALMGEMQEDQQQSQKFAPFMSGR